MEMDRHNARKMLERELREQMEMEDKRGTCTKMQSAQLAAVKAKRLKEIEDDIEEGEKKMSTYGPNPFADIVTVGADSLRSTVGVQSNTLSDLERFRNRALHANAPCLWSMSGLHECTLFSCSPVAR